MVISDNKYISSGSTALNPKKKPYNDDYNDARKREREEKRKAREAKLKSQAMIMSGIFVFFILTFSVIFRYSMIYKMQMNLEAAETNVSDIQKDNQNLSLQLLQYNNISTIESKAAKLNMIDEQKSGSVSLNYDKQTLKQPQATETQTNDGIINKILNIFKK